jgi:hypothetical protein
MIKAQEVCNIHHIPSSSSSRRRREWERGRRSAALCLEKSREKQYAVQCRA